ncbi:hypothetical protein SK128_010645, partial [Halocaridina rubra]
LKITAVFVISVSGGGLLGFLTHPFSLGGPWVLLVFRIIMGISQVSLAFRITYDNFKIFTGISQVNLDFCFIMGISNVCFAFRIIMGIKK